MYYATHTHKLDRRLLRTTVMWVDRATYIVTPFGLRLVIKVLLSCVQLKSVVNLDEILFCPCAELTPWWPA